MYPGRQEGGGEKLLLPGRVRQEEDGGKSDAAWTDGER